MRGEQLHLAERRDAKLHAGAEELFAGDPLLDDGAALGELRRVGRETLVRLLEAHVAHLRFDRRALVGRALVGRALVGRARHRQTLEIHERVPLARHSLVQLDEDLSQSGLARPQRGDGLDDGGNGRQVLDPEGVGNALLGEQAA